MNGYIGLYRGRRAECHAATSYEAQKILAKKLKARKSYEVTVVLAEKDGDDVVHTFVD
ncbi:MAG: hypothetical protein GY759_09045 [Chloroflexi bacterium]|nr:hypothetical protein [Chloroflexota bacterium]